MKIQKLILVAALFLGVFLFACGNRNQNSNSSPAVKENTSPNFVYLFPTQQLVEIFHFDTNTRIPEKLTESGGRVIDYAVNPRNSQIVYSAQNDFGGADLWLFEGSQKNATLLVNCKEKICTDPSISPDGGMVTYQQGKFPFESSNYVNNDDIHLISLENDGSLLPADQTIHSGMNVIWSPDGKYIAYFESEKESIRIIDLNANEILLIKSLNQTAAYTWGLNSDYFYFVLEDSVNDIPVSLLEEVYLPEKTFKRKNIALMQNEVINGLKHSPTKNQLAISIRLSTFLPGQKIAIYELQTEEIVQETDQPDMSYGNFSWFANGEMIIYQRYAFNSGEATPEIGIWDLQGDTHEIYLNNAVMPNFFQ